MVNPAILLWGAAGFLAALIVRGFDLYREKSLRQIVMIRLDRLVSLKELELSEDRYVIGRGVFLLPAKIVFAFHRLLFPPRR